MSDIITQRQREVLQVLKSKLSHPENNSRINWYYIFTDNTLLKSYRSDEIKSTLISLYQAGRISLSDFSCSSNGDVLVFIIDGVT